MTSENTNHKDKSITGRFTSFFLNIHNISLPSIKTIKYVPSHPMVDSIHVSETIKSRNRSPYNETPIVRSEDKNL